MGPLDKDPKTHRRCRLLDDTFRKNLSKDSIYVLDAGCGEGFFSNHFKKLGCHPIGIDISSKAIYKAMALYPNIRFEICSLEDELPFENKAFDVVWSCEVIEHIFDVDTYLKELNRVLELNGLFIMTTPYHGLLKNLLVVLLRFNHHFCNIEGGHIRFFTNGSLKALLKKSGFEVIERRYIGRFRPFSNCIYVVGRKSRDIK